MNGQQSEGLYHNPFQPSGPQEQFVSTNPYETQVYPLSLSSNNTHHRNTSLTQNELQKNGFMTQQQQNPPFVQQNPSSTTQPISNFNQPIPSPFAEVQHFYPEQKQTAVFPVTSTFPSLSSRSPPPPPPPQTVPQHYLEWQKPSQNVGDSLLVSNMPQGEYDSTALERFQEPRDHTRDGNFHNTQDLSMALTSPLTSDFLGHYEPISLPKPIVMPTLSSVNVRERCMHLHMRGVLTNEEYNVISNLVNLLPTKITLAFDRLEIGDRQGIVELLNMDVQVPISEFNNISSRNPFDAGLSSWDYPPGIQKDRELDIADTASEDSEPLIEADEAMARRLQEQFNEEVNGESAPHPAAGGFRDPLPKNFLMVNGDLLGDILLRVSSKKLFRKWKKMFFVADRDRICFFERSKDFEAKHPPRIVYRMHSCMFIKTPEAKQTFSVLDENRRVYHTTFDENITEEGGANHYTGKRSAQCQYKFNQPSSRICKFGSTNLNEITAFACALNGIIQWKRTEKSHLLATEHALQQSGTRAGRYN